MVETVPAARVEEPAAAVRRRPERALTLVTGLCAAAPVIASTVRALAAGWAPVGDQGIIATRAYDVFSSHAPLVGQYSQASTVAGRPLYSPGPMLYWLLALPARLGGDGSIAVTIAIVNVAAIVGSVALARRRGGVPLMLACACALAVMCRSFSAENLHDVFNPAAALLPLTLLVFLAWSVACGDLRLLPLAVLVASFVAQCHLAYVLPVAGLLAVAAAGLGAARPRRPARWLAASALVAVACWSAPLVDHANLGRIVSAGTSQRATQGATPAWRAVARAVGVVPRWLRAPTSVARDLGDVSGGDYGDTRLGDVWTPPSALATASAVAFLVALAGIGAAGVRRRRADLAAGAAIGLVLCGTLAADVASTPVSATNTLGYTTWWGSVAGMWVWLFTAWAVTRALPVRLPRRPALVGGLAAVAAAAALATAAARPDAHKPFYRPAAELAARLERAVPAGRSVWLVQRGFLLVPIEPALRYELRRHGVRALGHLATLRAGDWYELDHRRYDHVVETWSNGNQPPVPPRAVVARVPLSDPKGRHTITAALSR